MIWTSRGYTLLLGLKRVWTVVLGLLFANISACSIELSEIPIFSVVCNRNMNELQKYFDEERAKPGDAVAPLPKKVEYPTILYKAEKLRDPFSPIEEEEPPQKAATQGKVVSMLQPDLNRTKDKLESYPLDSLQMMGTVEKDGERCGLIRASDGEVRQVKVGNYMGQNHGQISQINIDQIFLTEIIPGPGGVWTKREAKIALPDQ
ncbi:type IV pilus assembly protein PilP [Gammaproteobacteria bacterium]